MDVDALKTRDEYMKHMNGKCFSCGGTGHVKTDCPHVGSWCGYCGRKGHRDLVCESKFHGKPKTATVRLTDAEDRGEGSSTSQPASVKAPSEDWQAALAALMDSQKLLQDQVAAMKQAF